MKKAFWLIAAWAAVATIAVIALSVSIFGIQDARSSAEAERDALILEIKEIIGSTDNDDADAVETLRQKLTASEQTLAVAQNQITQQETSLSENTAALEAANTLIADLTAANEKLENGLAKDEKVASLQAQIDEKDKKLTEAAAQVARSLRAAEQELPEDFQTDMSHVLIALQNGFYRLLHTADSGEAVRETVMQGGDTIANAVVTGALMGAAQDLDSFPAQWLDTVLACVPEEGRPGVAHPRPEAFWPVDFMPLAEKLLG